MIKKYQECSVFIEGRNKMTKTKESVIKKLKKSMNFADREISDGSSINQFWSGKKQGLYQAIELIKEIDGKSAPVVKQCIADWFEKNKNKLTDNIFELCCDLNDHIPQNEFERWFIWEKDAIDILVHMKDGYTVEANSCWIVKTKMDNYFEKFYGEGIQSLVNVNRDKAFIFDDENVANSVAKLIGGSVEEY